MDKKNHQSNHIPVSITLCRTNSRLPFYANPGDAGMDIVAASEVTLRPGETKPIPTGIKVAIPVGYEIQVRPRSGLSLNTPLRIPNAPGTIDSGFRDEVHVIMSNSSTPDSIQTEAGENNPTEIFTVSTKGNQKGIYKILPGDRIAQLVLHAVPVIQWEVLDNLDGVGSDRGGGFGSSGEKIK